jgi:hypothetical protein
VTALLLAALAGAVSGSTARVLTARVRLLFSPHPGRRVRPRDHIGRAFLAYLKEAAA